MEEEEKTTWREQTGHRVDFVQVFEEYIVLGTHRSGKHTTDRTRCSHADFLEGDLKERIRQIFGTEALEHMEEVVRKKVRRSSE